MYNILLIYNSNKILLFDIYLCYFIKMIKISYSKFIAQTIDEKEK